MSNPFSSSAGYQSISSMTGRDGTPASTLPKSRVTNDGRNRGHGNINNERTNLEARLSPSLSSNRPRSSLKMCCLFGTIVILLLLNVISYLSFSADLSSQNTALKKTNSRLAETIKQFGKFNKTVTNGELEEEVNIKSSNLFLIFSRLTHAHTPLLTLAPP